MIQTLNQTLIFSDSDYDSDSDFSMIQTLNQTLIFSDSSMIQTLIFL